MLTGDSESQGHLVTAGQEGMGQGQGFEEVMEEMTRG